MHYTLKKNRELAPVSSSLLLNNHESIARVGRGHYLVERPISTVVDHLEGDVGAVLDAWDASGGGFNADAKSGCPVPLEITDDELV